MKPRERRLLQLYLYFRENRPTVGRLLWVNRKLYALTFLVFGGFIAWLAVNFSWGIAGYFITALAAALLRDVGHFLRTVRTWPILSRFIDWPKVEQHVAGVDHSS